MDDLFDEAHEPNGSAFEAILHGEVENTVVVWLEEDAAFLDDGRSERAGEEVGEILISQRGQPRTGRGKGAFQKEFAMALSAELVEGMAQFFRRRSDEHRH